MKKRVKRCSMCGKDNDIAAFECECGCSDLEIVTVEYEESELLAHDFEKEDISEGICSNCNAIMPFMVGKCFICGGTIVEKTSEISSSESKGLSKERDTSTQEETPRRLALVDEKGSGAVFYLTDGLHVLGRARDGLPF